MYLFFISEFKSKELVISMHMIINYYFMNQNHLLNLMFSFLVW